MSKIRNRVLLPLLLCATLPFTATATAASPLSESLAEARREVQHDLAKARAELESGNLELGQGLVFGKAKDRADGLPRAEITPQGDFLVDGKAVAITAQQRRELLDYRNLALNVARAGIDVGEQAVAATFQSLDRGLVGLIASALAGTFDEEKFERDIKARIEPGVVQLCSHLEPLRQSQQKLGESLPQFRPYATLTRADVDDCVDEVRREFASN